MNKRGFTLVEMMAVIVLVSVLGVIAVATYTNVNESAKQKTLESKKEEIRTSAMKWARENNITSKTIISVNALVVEGYLTADENEMGKIGFIENPVTGENMICNTVDISFKNSEMVADVDDKIQNCDLASQSLIDENIQIKVIDENNVNKTGGGAIANWTNKNVIIVVSSSEYDPNAVSISFDFEGNTKTNMISGSTQYTGDRYLTKDAAKSYYNVFNVDGNLLLDSNVVVTYALNDGTVKSRSYRIRIDKEEATASIKSNNEWLTTEKPIYVLVDDGKGSGAKGFIISTDDRCNNIVYNQPQTSYDGTPVTLDIGKYYVWTEDNAGNRSDKAKIILEVNNVDATEPWCEVYFDGTKGDHGWFKENPVQPYGRNNAEHLAGLSGFNLGVNQSENSPEYSTYAEYDSYNAGPGELRDRNTEKSGEMYYCHVKTLAGNYANNSDRLFLDMDAPTISINLTNPDVHTKTKEATISLYDALSGLNASTEVRLGFSLSPTSGPTTWETVTITAPEQTNQVVTKTVNVGSSLTGTWYLYIDTSSFKDYAGNYAEPPSMSNGDHMFVYGPFKFDNTKPQCTSNNGKTTWTDGDYLITQNCGDADGTTDQSGCKQASYDSYYSAVTSIWSDSLVIEDNAGNTRTCNYDIYLDNDNPKCNGNNGKSKWTKGSWTGNQKCKDSYSGCEKNPFSYTWSSSTDQSSITIKDNVGHTTSCAISVRLDTEAPVCTTTATQAEGSWTNGTVTLTGKCTSDSGGSGCSTRKSTASFSDEQAQSQTPGSIADKAGNETPCPYFTVRIDKTKPYISCSKTNTGTTSGVTAVIVANDDMGRYKSGYKSTTPTKTTGLKSSKTYTARDYAGNTNTCTVTVTPRTEYRYHTRSVKTCTKSCCGTYESCTTKHKSGIGVSCSGTVSNDIVAGSWHYYDCTTCTTKNYTCTDATCCGYTRWSSWSAWGGTENICDTDLCKSSSHIVYD